MAKKITLNELKKLVKKTLNESKNDDVYIFGSSKDQINSEIDDFQMGLKDKINDFIEKYTNLFNILESISEIFSSDFSLKIHRDTLESDMERSKEDLQDVFDYFIGKMRGKDLKSQTKVIFDFLDTLEDYHMMTDLCLKNANSLIQKIENMEPSQIKSEIRPEEFHLAPY